MIGLLQPRAQSVSPMLFDNECGALIGHLGPLAVGHDLGEADPLLAAERQGRVRSCARELAIGVEGTDPSGVPGLLVVEVRCSWDIGRHPCCSRAIASTCSAGTGPAQVRMTYPSSGSERSPASVGFGPGSVVVGSAV